jgi:hypothetical protein
VSTTASGATFDWSTVVNNGDPVPGSARKFNSYSPPSVNARGLVVFRGRSRGGQGQGEPERGVYARNISNAASVVVRIADVQTSVPQPNNTLYNGQLASFNEFPAFPRIGVNANTVATRGQSQPVWTYILNGTETRVGTSGIYATPNGALVTGMAQLGAVPSFSHFQVPGATPGTKFDQFPGAPTLANASVTAFKGNYTDGVPKTGVFYRDMLANGGLSPTQLIASSDTLIPGQPAGGAKFGSTAPPSAENGSIVFLGVDNESNPKLGGIYRAPAQPTPALQALVRIGGPVPGESAVFNRLGEALSFDGRFVAFWGAWGKRTRTVSLFCPTEGNAAVIAYCNDKYGTGGYEVQVPVRQGIFVYDTQTRQLRAAAKTGANFADFLFWTFSGRPPGGGGGEEDDFEPARWRASSFVAVTRDAGATYSVAFKARTDAAVVRDGIYLRRGPGDGRPIETVLDTTTSGQVVDPEAPPGSIVASVAIERDGFRNGLLSLSASMLDATTGESWAGVYLTRISVR